jgi:F0F1-type ATP synthase gamma subunit
LIEEAAAGPAPASQAAAYASRLAATQSAESRNHEKLLELDLQYRQLRPSSITEELIEITTGSESIVDPPAGRG